MWVLCQSTGARLQLLTDDLLGAGGEATIHAVSSDPQLAAKLWRAPGDHARRLAAMLKMPAPGRAGAEPGHVPIAWPVDGMLDESGNVVGFLMPRVRRAHSVLRFANPGIRREQLPLFSYRYLLRSARNLAAAIRSLHEAGVVVADVNESNILVTETALVTLVDADSFQITDADGHIWPCPVARPEYTAPELLRAGAQADYSRRTPQHDLFGLAVVLFQMLMEGTHPFAGRSKDRTLDPAPYDVRIASGDWPWATTREVSIEPLPGAPRFDALPETTQKMFRRALEQGHDDPAARPAAAEWQAELETVEAGLVTCRVNDQHRYAPHLGHRCPWCERRDLLGGRDPFPSRDDVRSDRHLNANELRRLRPAQTPTATPAAATRQATQQRAIQSVTRHRMAKKPAPSSDRGGCVAVLVIVVVSILLKAILISRGMDRPVRPPASAALERLRAEYERSANSHKPPLHGTNSNYSDRYANSNRNGSPAANVNKSMPPPDRDASVTWLKQVNRSDDRAGPGINSLAVSADFDCVAWTDGSGAALVWRTAWGTEKELPCPGAVREVVIGDDLRLAASLEDGRVQIFDCSGDVPHLIRSLDVDADGPLACSGASVRYVTRGQSIGALYLKNGVPGGNLWQGLEHEQITKLAYADGRGMLAASRSGLLLGWKTDSAEKVPLSRDEAAVALCMARTADVRLTVWARSAQIVDDGAPLVVPPGDDNRYTAGALSPDGRLAVLAREFRSVQVVPVSSRVRGESWPENYTIRDLGQSVAATHVAISNGGGLVFATSDGQVMMVAPGDADQPGEPASYKNIAQRASPDPVEPAEPVEADPLLLVAQPAGLVVAINQGSSVRMFRLPDGPADGRGTDWHRSLAGGRTVMSLQLHADHCVAVDSTGRHIRMAFIPDDSDATVAVFSPNSLPSPGGLVAAVPDTDGIFLRWLKGETSSRINGAVASRMAFSDRGGLLWYVPADRPDALMTAHVDPIDQWPKQAVRLRGARINTALLRETDRLLITGDDRGCVWLWLMPPSNVGPARRLLQLCQLDRPIAELDATIDPDSIGSRLISVRTRNGEAHLFRTDGVVLSELTGKARTQCDACALTGGPGTRPRWVIRRGDTLAVSVVHADGKIDDPVELRPSTD